MFLLFFWLLLTVGISIWNAHVVGRYWTERHQLPGWTQFMLWCGVIMSVCGFFAVTVSILTMIMHDTHLFEALALALFKWEMTPSDVEGLVQNVFDLAYLAIIFPVLGTGLAITINSWIIAVARRDWASAGIAAYNTGAQIYNTVRAFRHVPQATRSLGSGFKLRLGKDSGKAVAYLVLLLFPVIISLGVSIAATAIIMKASDERYQLEDVARQAARLR